MFSIFSVTEVSIIRVPAMGDPAMLEVVRPSFCPHSTLGQRRWLRNERARLSKRINLEKEGPILVEEAESIGPEVAVGR
jgi:hypothetical protein